MLQKSRITFLNEVTSEEIYKVSILVEYANRAINAYFGTVTSFDVLICRGSWEMEVQVASRRRQSEVLVNNETRLVGLTDYRLEEIIIRSDIAEFGHYLHELLHGIISKNHPHQLREGLAWYFTLKLTEKYRYVRPAYPSWVNEEYIRPAMRLARIVGDDFMKDLVQDKASIEYDLLPLDVRELFGPEEIFYSKRRRD
jgi:hypothetical protein